MSEAAEALRSLAAQVDQAAGALRGARFGEFSDLAAQIEQAESSWRGCCSRIHGDPDAETECLRLRRSLDRLGSLLGHVAGVHQALTGLDPLHAAVYDRSGAGVAGGRSMLREEA